MPDTTLTLTWHKGHKDHKNKPAVLHVYIHTYNTNRSQLRTRFQIREKGGKEGQGETLKALLDEG